MLEKKTVNRKEFHYLLAKFLMKHRLSQRFYNTSLEYKTNKCSPYNFNYEKYNFSEKEDFSTHLYKCIDIYTKEGNVYGQPYIDVYYRGGIHGFFSLVPSTFEKDYITFWRRYSDLWRDATFGIKFEDI